MGFLEEPLLGGVILRQIRWQELDGDRTFEAWVSGLIDDAHPAAAKLGDDLVGAELGTGGQGHARGKYIAGLEVRRVALHRPRR